MEMSYSGLDDYIYAFLCYYHGLCVCLLLGEYDYLLQMMYIDEFKV